MPFFTFQETILLKELAYGGARYLSAVLHGGNYPFRKVYQSSKCSSSGFMDEGA